MAWGRLTAVAVMLAWVGAGDMAWGQWKPSKPTPPGTFGRAERPPTRTVQAVPMRQVPKPATAPRQVEEVDDVFPQPSVRAAAMQAETPKTEAPPKPTVAMPTPEPSPAPELVPQPMPEMIEGDYFPGADPTVSAGECWDEGCCPCGPKAWGRAEYLLWWTKGMHTPPLATTSPDGTVQEQAGVLGIPTTTILFGDGGLNDQAQSGGRFSVGYWFDDARGEGIEVNYLTLGQQTDRFSASDAEYDILARPFFNIDTGEQDSRLIVYPDLVSGNLSVVGTTSFQSFEVMMRQIGHRTACSRVDYLIGYRYGSLRDQLRIHEFSTALSGAAEGTEIDLVDRFDTRNTFNGVNLGMVWQWQANRCWSWEASAKVALGVSACETFINGQTTTTLEDESVTDPYGLLALETNSGHYERTSFGSIGEVGLSTRRTFCNGWTAIVGYRFLYWADVARAGNQIDTTINPTQIDGDLEGDARPRFLDRKETFWAHGLNFGLEYAF